MHPEQGPAQLHEFLLTGCQVPSYESREGFSLLTCSALSGGRAQGAKEWQADKINGCRESVVCLQEEGRVN